MLEMEALQGDIAGF